MLTAKQYKTLAFIQEFMKAHPYAPTTGEIAQGIQIKSRGVVYRYLTALANAGYIELVPGQRRNIKLLKEGESAKQNQLPILGTIAAGSPIEAIDNHQQLDFNEQVIAENRFMLQVKGNSMLGDSICDGDYIICERRQEVSSNEIAIVLIDGQEATLKRVINNQDGTLSLLSSNPNYKQMTYNADQVVIQGVYIGLLRLQS